MSTMEGAVAGVPRLMLRAEGVVLLVAGTALFAYSGESYWLYALLFFAPDLGFAGYLLGPRKGAAIYNALHTTLAPALLAGIALLADLRVALSLAAIWAAHIGFDRAPGYGLKY